MEVTCADMETWTLLHQDSVCDTLQEFSHHADHRLCSISDPESHLLCVHPCNDVVSVLVNCDRFNQFRGVSKSAIGRSSFCLRGAVRTVHLSDQRNNVFLFFWV